jgi:hypothetical protein
MQPEVEKDPKLGKNTGNAGKGRPKGATNKNSKLLKDAILEAAERAGGKRGMVAYLEEQAKENPTAFMTLMGKVLPMQVQGTGEKGEHEFVIRWKR